MFTIMLGLLIGFKISMLLIVGIGIKLGKLIKLGNIASLAVFVVIDMLTLVVESFAQTEDSPTWPP